MKEKTILITGANSGIGRVATMELAKLGANIIMVCRNEEKAKAVQDDINAVTGLNNVDLFIADMSSHKSIKAFAKAFYKKYDQLDVLINNAGMIVDKLEYNDAGIEMTMATNHFGYFYMCHYMLPALKKSPNARIVNVASLAHRLTPYPSDNLNADKSFGFFKQYSVSKLCNVLFSKKLSEILKNNTNITVNSLHPGNIASNFGKAGGNWFGSLIRNFNFVLTTPQKGAETIIYLAASPLVQNKTGLYWYKKNPVIPAVDAIQSDNAQHLWDWSLEKSGIKVYGEFDLED
ncbi:MAG: SDR family oxidoreductase [Sphingobacteriales bacterium]|jgi:NAD(P)-dependent dehydrogenase (short-subunit alcohol dehydrogenase family)|nr:MAG: SDR family oxidoreductase [Sphingobacteriales bacterium]